MKSNKTSLLITVAVIGLSTFVLYDKLIKPSLKQSYAKHIHSSGMAKGEVSVLMSFDKGYLRAWSEGIKKGSPQFVYQGKAYKTGGGTAVV